MAAQHYTTDLQQALESQLPYDFLSFTLRQRLTLQTYLQESILFAAMRYYSYQRLSEFLRSELTEANYYKMMIDCLQKKLQLYPYLYIRNIVQWTKETPLTYYITMVEELLKAEKSYDTLPNFTAVDVLNSIGIGRNQYLELTKVVRRKMRWYASRQFLKNYIPTELLSSVVLPPFWDVFAVDMPTEVVKRASLTSEEGMLYRQLLKRRFEDGRGVDNIGNADGGGCMSCYACELPYEPVNRLFRKGLVCATFTVNPDDYVIVPPLERFVMNRTSDEPAEVLLYRVLATIDNRTPLSLLAQLLMLDQADVCTAVHMYIRLGLAQLKTIHIPENFAQSMEAVHETWRDLVNGVLTEATTSSLSSLMVRSTTGALTLSAEDSNDNVRGGGHPARRVALLYDASLTGFLMMTNLSADPTFKQNAVTLFEVGKLSEEMIGSFIDKLEQVGGQTEQDLGGDAMKYIQSVLCLREVLKALRRIVGPDKESGVDMLKVESLNELEPTTRYSVLGRNYWAYFVISPVSYAPLIDMALNSIYGSTVSLMPSPWMTLLLYTKMGTGPPSLLLPIGARLASWPLLLQDSENGVAKLRLQSFTTDAEITYVDASTSIILLNEMTAMAPLFVQRVEEVPLEPAREGNYLTEASTHISFDVILPFAASDTEALELLRLAVMRHCHVTEACFVNAQKKNDVSAFKCFIDLFHAAVTATRLQDSLGYFTFHVSLHEVDLKHVANLTFITETKASLDGANSTSTETILNENEEDRVHCYYISKVFITDIGLGFPLTNQDCCSVMLRHLENILSETRSESHNDAMRLLADDFGVFLNHYSSLTLSAREKMALLSTTVSVPTTQMHIRRLGEDGNGGVPFPGTIIFFNGEELSVVDDWNPLVELWQV